MAKYENVLFLLRTVIRTEISFCLHTLLHFIFFHTPMFVLDTIRLHLKPFSIKHSAVYLCNFFGKRAAFKSTSIYFYHLYLIVYFQNKYVLHVQMYLIITLNSFALNRVINQYLNIRLRNVFVLK